MKRQGRSEILACLALTLCGLCVKYYEKKIIGFI